MQILSFLKITIIPIIVARIPLHISNDPFYCYEYFDSLWLESATFNDNPNDYSCVRLLHTFSFTDSQEIEIYRHEVGDHIVIWGKGSNLGVKMSGSWDQSDIAVGWVLALHKANRLRSLAAHMAPGTLYDFWDLPGVP